MIAEAGQAQLFEIIQRTGKNLIRDSSMFRVAFSDLAGIVTHVLTGEVDVGMIRMDFLDAALALVSRKSSRREADELLVVVQAEEC